MEAEISDNKVLKKNNLAKQSCATMNYRSQHLHIAKMPVNNLTAEKTIISLLKSCGLEFSHVVNEAQ